MLITTVFRNLLRIYIRANTRKVTLLILHGDLMFSPQMKDRTIKIEVLLFSAKISLTNAVLEKQEEKICEQDEAGSD